MRGWPGPSCQLWPACRRRNPAEGRGTPAPRDLSAPAGTRVRPSVRIPAIPGSSGTAAIGAGPGKPCACRLREKGTRFAGGGRDSPWRPWGANCRGGGNSEDAGAHRPTKRDCGGACYMGISLGLCGQWPAAAADKDVSQGQAGGFKGAEVFFRQKGKRIRACDGCHGAVPRALRLPPANHLSSFRRFAPWLNPDPVSFLYQRLMFW